MTLILSGTDGVSDVDGSAATPAVRGTDTNTGIFFPAADTIAFAEGGAEVARITSTAAWSFGASGTATGTSGQALVSGGSGAAPAWGALGAAGGGTGLTSPGTNGNVLTSNGTAWTSTAPSVTAPAGTTGQVQINNAGAFGAVGSGTTGQVLTSQGTGAAPVFATPSVGAMTLISTTNASASATVDISFSGSFSQYIVIINNVQVSVSGSSFEARGAFGGNFSSTLPFLTSFVFFDPGFGPNGADRDDGRLMANIRSGTNYPFAGAVTIYSPANTTNFKVMTFQVSAKRSSDLATIADSGGGVCVSASAMTGIRFRLDSGNITGTFLLYGIS